MNSSVAFNPGVFLFVLALAVFGCGGSESSEPPEDPGVIGPGEPSGAASEGESTKDESEIKPGHKDSSGDTESTTAHPTQRYSRMASTTLLGYRRPKSPGSESRVACRLVAQSEDSSDTGKDDAPQVERPAPKAVCLRLARCKVDSSAVGAKAPDSTDDNGTAHDGEQGESSQSLNLNDPPNLYVVVKSGNSELVNTESQSGWRVEFPDDWAYEIVIESDAAKEYAFDLYDSQWIRDPRITRFGPHSGEQIVKAILDDVDNAGEDTPSCFLKNSRAELVFDLVGFVYSCRLKHISVPADSPSRTPFDEDGNEIPEMRVRLYRDGVPVETFSEHEWSDVLPVGWEGTFPQTSRNTWNVLEGSDARYDIEVQDTNWGNELVFRISDLKGEDFRKEIKENAGEHTWSEEKATLRFEPLKP